MIALTLNKRGQVFFPKDLLHHLGIKAGGGEIEYDMLRNGAVELRARQPAGAIDDFGGVPAGAPKVDPNSPFNPQADKRNQDNDQ